MIKKYYQNTHILIYVNFLIPFYILICTENRLYDYNLAALHISKGYTISQYAVKAKLTFAFFSMLMLKMNTLIVFIEFLYSI